MRQGLRIVLLVALLALGAGPPALAAGPGVVRDGDRLVVDGGPASESVSIWTEADGRLALTGVGLDGAALPPDCTWDGSRLQCPPPASVEVHLGAGDDRFTHYGAALPMLIDDGPGDDSIDHGDGDATYSTARATIASRATATTASSPAPAQTSFTVAAALTRSPTPPSRAPCTST